MMQSVAFALVFLAILLLPGLALSQVIGRQWVKCCRFLFALGFSYASFVLALGAFQLLQISWSYFSIYIGSIITFSILGIIISFVRSGFKRVNDFLRLGIAPIFIISLVSCYHFLVGPYNDIPADIYAHLGYFQRALDFQQQGIMGESNWVGFFMQKGLVWYHFLAFCSQVSGANIEAVIYITTWLTKVLFLLGVYFFSLRIFVNMKNAKVIALLTTVFLSLHMGINVMAYVRYYSFAPTMLNLILYFSAVVIFLQLIREKNMLVIMGQLTYLVLLILATAAIHTQEALFIVVMCSTIALVYVVFSLFKFKITAEKDLSFYSSKVILLVAIIGFIMVYLIARNKLERAPNVGWRLWEFGEVNSWLPKLTILNLKYQFIRVITLWGILVYIAAIFYWRDIRQNTFLVAGLISPAFTVMNPFFVDLFLRLDNSTTLWRLSYLIPLHFVAAFIVVKIVSHFREAGSSNFQKALGVVFIVLSVTLLLPYKNTYAGLHYSRFPTLMSVNSKNNYDHIDDVINALEAIEKKHIVLTDPVTGYVISGMTRHHSYRHKFFPRHYLNFSFDDYSDFPLRKHKGKLLLINSRSGENSQVGALSQHWAENVLDVSGYYPSALMEHLQANSTQFSLLWKSASGDMRLYKIL